MNIFKTKNPSKCPRAIMTSFAKQYVLCLFEKRLCLHTSIGVDGLAIQCRTQ